MSQTKVKSGLIDFTEGIDSFIEFSGGNSTVTGNLTVTGTLVGYTPTASLNISNWDTAYSYSQVGHLPLTGGTLTGQLTTSDTGTSSSIVITSDSIGNGAIDLIKNTNGTGIRITNNGVGSGIVAFNNSTGTGITIANTSTGKGLLIDNSSSTTGDPFVYTLGGAAYVKAKINYVGNLTLAGTITASGYNNSNWDTAYGWGNHASAGYLTSFDITTQTDAKYLRSDESDTMSGSLTVTGGLTVDTDTLYIDSVSNKVGIGTTIPGGKLHIAGDGDSSNLIRLQHTGTGGNGYFDISTTSTSASLIANYSSTAIPMLFYTGAQERMRIDSSGKVIIGGTVASNVGLTIYGSNSATIYQTPTSGTGAGNGLYIGQVGDVSYLWNYNNFPMVFATNNTERIRISSSGYVSVGTIAAHGNFTAQQTTGEAGITINSSIAEPPTIYLRDAGGAGYSRVLANNNLFIEANKVGIGATLPETKLHVVGTDNSGSRTTPLNVLTITGENGNSPYDGFGGAILFKNRIYDGGPSPGGIREGARIRTRINTNSGVNYGTDLIFENTATGDGALQTVMALRFNGAVAIGTIDPSDYKLRVVSSGAGGIRVDTVGSTFGSPSINARNGSVDTVISATSNGLEIGTWSSNDIIFKRAQSERARITANGLTFNGDTAAANALDDYEEGTWAPSGNVASYSRCTYTKIGRTVFLQGTINMSSAVSGDPLRLSGIPYNSNANFEAVGSVMWNNASLPVNATQLTTYMYGGSNQLEFYWSYSTNTPWSAATFAHMSNADLIIQLTYQV